MRAVEDCLTLDIARLLTVADRAALAHVDEHHIPDLVIEDDQGGKTTIELTYTIWTVNGARRWWLVCPTCGRSVRCLYLPGRDGLGCRACHALAYAAWQNADERWLMRRIPPLKLSGKLERLEQSIARRCYLTPQKRVLLAEYAALQSVFEKQSARRQLPSHEGKGSDKPNREYHRR